MALISDPSSPVDSAATVTMMKQRRGQNIPEIAYLLATSEGRRL
jgi:hypothetical protein